MFIGIENHTHIAQHRNKICTSFIEIENHKNIEKFSNIFAETSLSRAQKHDFGGPLKLIPHILKFVDFYFFDHLKLIGSLIPLVLDAPKFVPLNLRDIRVWSSLSNLWDPPHSNLGPSHFGPLKLMGPSNAIPSHFAKLN